MIGVFLKILNAGIIAGWVVVGILLLRPLFAKAPKWIQCLLWGIVAVRLLLPVTLQSSMSLIPSPEVIPQNVTQSQIPAINSGIPAVNSIVNPLFAEELAPEGNLLDTILSAATVLWLVGVGVMLVLGVISCWRLHRKLRVCLQLRENIFICDEVDSPFVFGVFRPRIYLPSNMEEGQLCYVLAHEKAHIHRKDHWWKPLGYLLLTVYWFHPLLWVAYSLLCRDIERACDEKVIAKMDPEEKKGYSEALVACSIHRRLVLTCPVAFGEVSVKARIKGVLRYKKPALWVLLITGAVCVLTACCFLTDPLPCTHVYQSVTTQKATCTHTGVQTNTCQQCGHVYMEKTAMLEHSYDQGVVENPSSCIHKGTLLRSCTGCDAQMTQHLELAEHTAVEPYFLQEADCTQTGKQSATCSVCQAVFVTQILPVNDVHDLQETVVKAATCTADGEGVKTCSRCNYQENVIYKKTGHTFGEPFDFIKATCMSSGTRRTYCTKCFYYIDETIPQYDHHWMPATEGTYMYCSGCRRTKKNSSNTDLQPNYNPYPQHPAAIWPCVTLV